MTSIRIAVDYDSEGDILYITFESPERPQATSYQISCSSGSTQKPTPWRVSQSSISHTTLRLNAKSRYPMSTAACLVSLHPRRSTSSSLSSQGRRD